MKEMNRQLKTDIVEWDIPNWSRAISFWDIDGKAENLSDKKVLEIGGRSGGLSLYFALAGAKVVCSDLCFVQNGSYRKAEKLHKKYGVSDSIRYEDINGLDIPYTNEFDIICFKSVLGGVGVNDRYDNQIRMMKQIYKALKPGGICYFVENLTGSNLITFLRRKIRPWGSRWRYLSLSEIAELTKEFNVDRTNTFGVIGLLGRGKLSSSICGWLDKRLEVIVPPKNRYIVSCICRKPM